MVTSVEAGSPYDTSPTQGAVTLCRTNPQPRPRDPGDGRRTVTATRRAARPEVTSIFEYGDYRVRCMDASAGAALTRSIAPMACRKGVRLLRHLERCCQYVDTLQLGPLRQSREACSDLRHVDSSEPVEPVVLPGCGRCGRTGLAPIRSLGGLCTVSPASCPTGSRQRTSRCARMMIVYASPDQRGFNQGLPVESTLPSGSPAAAADSRDA